MCCFVLIVCAVLGFGNQSAVCAVPRLEVAASISNLAAIAEEVGGERIRTQVICPPDENPHVVDLLPSHVIAVRQADVYLMVGMGLDAWAEDLVEGAEGDKLMVVDCSRSITPLPMSGHEHGHHSHSMEDPHYWLGPSNLYPIAKIIADSLSRLLPEAEGEFRKRLADLQTRLDSAQVVWRETLEPCREVGIVSYHPAWGYFSRDLGISVVGCIESGHGAQPTPRELAILAEKLREEEVRVILREPFEPAPTAQALAAETGARILPFPTVVGSGPGNTDVFSHFNYLVTSLATTCADSTQGGMGD